MGNMLNRKSCLLLFRFISYHVVWMDGWMLSMILKQSSLIWDLTLALQSTNEARGCLIPLRESAKAETLII